MLKLQETIPKATWRIPKATSGYQTTLGELPIYVYLYTPIANLLSAMALTYYSMLVSWGLP